VLFNSLEFIFLFLPAVLVVYYCISSGGLRQKWLTLASYFFYSFWSYKFAPLLFATTVFDFKVGQWLENTTDPKKKKLLITASVMTNLSLLGFFKYFYFLTGTSSTLLELIGVHWSAPSWNVILPIGISFYTFQSMSYTIDVYRGKSKSYSNFWAFAQYVSLFPQLIAGPIVRHSDLVPQILREEKVKATAAQFSSAIYFFAFGLAKKMLIADRLGLAVDQALNELQFLSMAESWLCALGYTLQLYFDFSGYSDMAIGLGLMLGYRLPQNFNSPYKSKSITEFWQRWHISLSRWLRDYLYISLGGNREGQFKTYRNLFLTMLLGGIWHGAGWTYVLWGVYHGSWLVVERVSEEFFAGNFLVRFFYKIPAQAKVFFTFIVVILGWVMFRSPTLPFAMLWYEKLFFNDSFFEFHGFATNTRDRFFAALVIGLFIVFGCKNLYEKENAYRFSALQAAWLAFLFFVSVLYLAKESPFLYFQF
jgi:alginate O-acetyltransferase complex protein AlgI